MNLYKLSQTVNSGYEIYDSVVVAAETADDARNTYPDVPEVHVVVNDKWHYRLADGRLCETGWDWAPPSAVVVELIGVAVLTQAAGVIVASYNAG